MTTLRYVSALQRSDLLAQPVRHALEALPVELAGQIEVAEIDPELADTAAMTQAYGFAPEMSANCVIVSGKRAGEDRHAAVLVLASDRADINNVARRHLDVRKLSFASTEFAVQQTSMAYGGIGPIGLPASWPLLVDHEVIAAPRVIIGSGVRRSKLFLPGSLLAQLPGAEGLKLSRRET